MFYNRPEAWTLMPYVNLNYLIGFQLITILGEAKYHVS